MAGAMADAAVKARFLEFGAEPMTTSPEEFARFISQEVVKWRDLIAKAGIKAEP